MNALEDFLSHLTLRRADGWMGCRWRLWFSLVLVRLYCWIFFIFLKIRFGQLQSCERFSVKFETFGILTRISSVNKGFPSLANIIMILTSMISKRYIIFSVACHRFLYRKEINTSLCLIQLSNSSILCLILTPFETPCLVSWYRRWYGKKQFGTWPAVTINNLRILRQIRDLVIILIRKNYKMEIMYT